MLKDDHIIRRLREREGRWTLVRLRDGREVRVLTIAWGYDLGDEHAHVTTNVSPPQEGLSADFFYTSDILEMIDEETGRTVFKAES